jgi:outer membrane protein OmpA-like peptidoglycan-associated protein
MCKRFSYWGIKSGRVIFAILLSFLLLDDISAQSGRNTILEVDRGVYLGGVIGNTGLSDDRISTLVKPFTRHLIGDYFEGEFSLGVGVINSTEYRTRLIPLDYRLNYHPFRRSQFESMSNWGGRWINPTDFYTYAGIGVLNYQNIRILRPDDPLTVDAGTTIQASEFWSLGKSWSGQAPVGIGTRVWLDPQTSLLLSFGYTFTTSNNLENFQQNRSDGYWSFTVGFSLRSIFGRIIPPYPSVPRPLPFFEPVPIIAEAKPELTQYFLPAMINFDLLSFEVDEPNTQKVDDIAKFMNYYSDLGIIIHGHTDTRGLDPINEALGHHRAWTIKDQLVQLGIQPDRVILQNFLYTRPIVPNNPRDGERLNRRVEFMDMELDNIAQYRNPRYSISELSPLATPALPGIGERFDIRRFRYDILNVDPTTYNRSQLGTLLEVLNTNPGISIALIGYSDGLPNDSVNKLLAESRGARIREFLIDHGINPNRVKNLHFWSDEDISEIRSKYPRVEGKILVIRTN